MAFQEMYKCMLNKQYHVGPGWLVLRVHDPAGPFVWVVRWVVRSQNPELLGMDIGGEPAIIITFLQLQLATLDKALI
jgi:hypothetical protein